MLDQIYSFLMSRSSSYQEDYIFPSKNPSKQTTYTMIRKAFQAVLNQLVLQGIVFHSLRNKAASHLAMSGATQGELMEVLGHRSPVMTRRYAHFNKSHLGKLLQRTNDNLMEL